jgi:hypothetical protein
MNRSPARRARDLFSTTSMMLDLGGFKGTKGTDGVTTLFMARGYSVPETPKLPVHRNSGVIPFSHKCLFVTSVIAFSGQATTQSPHA